MHDLLLWKQPQFMVCSNIFQSVIPKTFLLCHNKVESVRDWEQELSIVFTAFRNKIQGLLKKLHENATPTYYNAAKRVFFENVSRIRDVKVQCTKPISFFLGHKTKLICLPNVVVTLGPKLGLFCVHDILRFIDPPPLLTRIQRIRTVMPLFRRTRLWLNEFFMIF